MNPVIVNPLIKLYFALVAIGGIVGFWLGVKTSVILCEKITPHPKPSLEYIDNKRMNNALFNITYICITYIGTTCLGVIAGMAIAATLPLSIPYYIVLGF